MERESETLRPPPSLNAICRGGSLLPSPPAPGAYAPLAGAGCGAPREPWAFCAPPQRPGPPSCLCSGMVGHIWCGVVVVVVVMVVVVVVVIVVVVAWCGRVWCGVASTIQLGWWGRLVLHACCGVPRGVVCVGGHR
jgi:hypothetical protein